MTTELVEKIRIGDPLSDQELDDAIEFYSKMKSGLRLLGPRSKDYWRH